MAAPLSSETSALLDQVAQLSDALRNGQQGAREGLLHSCGSLMAELSHPMETMLMVLWSQVRFTCESFMYPCLPVPSMQPENT